MTASKPAASEAIATATFAFRALCCAAAVFCCTWDEDETADCRSAGDTVPGAPGAGEGRGEGEGEGKNEGRERDGEWGVGSGGGRRAAL